MDQKTSIFYANDRKRDVRFLLYLSLYLLLVDVTKANDLGPGTNRICSAPKSCSKNGPLTLQYMALQAKCRAHIKNYGCERLKVVASAEDKNKFISCEDPEALCRFEGSNDQQMLSCGQSVGGVLYDSVVGIIMLPKTLWEAAKGIPQHFAETKDCNTNLQAKIYILGNFRPADLSDEKIATLSCREVKDIAENKAASTLHQLRERRKRQMIQTGRSIDFYEMDLSETEIHALNYSISKAGPLTKAQCYEKTEATKVACAELTKYAMLAGGASGVVRSVARSTPVTTPPRTVPAVTLTAGPTAHGAAEIEKVTNKAAVTSSTSNLPLTPLQQKTWKRFDRKLDDPFKDRLKDFRKNDDLSFNPQMQGREGQIFLSDQSKTIALKRFFRKDIDMNASIKALEEARKKVEASKDLNKHLSVVKIHEKGKDWIVRDFDRNSVPLKTLTNNPAAETAKNELKKSLRGTQDPYLKKIREKLERNPISENLHWSPTLNRILIIDMTFNTYSPLTLPVLI